LVVAVSKSDVSPPELIPEPNYYTDYTPERLRHIFNLFGYRKYKQSFNDITLMRDDFSGEAQF